MVGDRRVMDVNHHSHKKKVNFLTKDCTSTYTTEMDVQKLGKGSIIFEKNEVLFLLASNDRMFYLN